MSAVYVLQYICCGQYRVKQPFLKPVKLLKNMKIILVLTFISLLSLSTFTAFGQTTVIEEFNWEITLLEIKTRNLLFYFDRIEMYQRFHNEKIVNKEIQMFDSINQINNLQNSIRNSQIQTVIQNLGTSEMDNQISNKQNQIVDLYQRTSNLESQLYSFEADYFVFKQWVTDIYYTFLFPKSG